MHYEEICSSDERKRWSVGWVYYGRDQSSSIHMSFWSTPTHISIIKWLAFAFDIARLNYILARYNMVGGRLATRKRSTQSP